MMTAQRKLAVALLLILCAAFATYFSPLSGRMDLTVSFNQLDRVRHVIAAVALVLAGLAAMWWLPKIVWLHGPRGRLVAVLTLIACSALATRFALLAYYAYDADDAASAAARSEAIDHGVIPVALVLGALAVTRWLPSIVLLDRPEGRLVAFIIADLFLVALIIVALGRSRESLAYAAAGLGAVAAGIAVCGVSI